MQTGVPIDGLDARRRITGVEVYHAATAVKGGQLVTAGGRVLTVVGRGPTFDAAIALAYEGVSQISFEGMQYRRDIGQKAKTQRESPAHSRTSKTSLIHSAVAATKPFAAENVRVRRRS